MPKLIHTSFSPERKNAKPLEDGELETVVLKLDKLLQTTVIKIEDVQMLQRFIWHCQNLEHFRIINEGIWATHHPDEVLAGKEDLFQLKF